MDGFKRNQNGTFTTGTMPGPGRPRGQSLKEFWRERFSKMSDDEKVAFTTKVGFDTIWRMAEGNPENKSDITSGGDKLTVNLIQYEQEHN